MDRAYGELSIQDGKVYSKNKDYKKFSKGFVQYSSIPTNSNDNRTINKLVENSNIEIKGFQVGIKCTTYAMKLLNNRIVQTKTPVTKDYNFTRLSEKNIKKDIKNFICPYAGKKESSLVRKRLIALENIYGDISGKKINFKIS